LIEEDVRFLRTTVQGIDMISPQYRRTVTLTNGKKQTNTECEGVDATFEEMRRMYPTAGGRFLNSLDVGQQRRVIFIGIDLATELFGSADPVGRPLLVDNIPFTVVGVMQKKIQTSMNNGPDTRRAIIPYTTFRTTYGYRYVNSIVVRPVEPSQQKSVMEQITAALGRKYRFDPKDEQAVRVWDFIEAEKINRKINLGISIFLFGVGFLTLLIAGVGVANVMYVVVKERTHEIGIKMAIGAKRKYILWQFIFEALFISFVGGTVGILFSWGVVTGVRMLPVDDGAMQFLGRPILSPYTTLFTVFILGAIGLIAGFFPARKAASVDPVESLRYE
jgi:putative ABC transport system permease protein